MISDFSLELLSVAKCLVQWHDNILYRESHSENKEIVIRTIYDSIYLIQHFFWMEIVPKTTFIYDKMASYNWNTTSTT